MQKREYWVDNIKIFACILVVLGHFFQSMVKSNLMMQDTIYNCFLQTITCFHVALFFLCSGFLYQSNSCIRTIEDWKKNLIRKASALLIPYIVFTSITWLLKVIFPTSVNNELGGLINVLIVNPTAPYWYLITLFIFFVIVPTIDKEKTGYFYIVVSVLLKILSLWTGGQTTFILTMILSNLIWFVIGMGLCFYKLPCVIENNKNILGPIITFITFLFCIFNFQEERQWIWIRFVIGIILCFGITFCFQIYLNKQNNLTKFLSQYTMPVYLMHTIIAASFRTLLFKINVTETWIHILLGMIVTFVGPVIIAIIMKKTKYLEIFLYPNKFIGRK